MAATAVSIANVDSPVAIAEETFNVTMDVSTSITLTGTTIIAIDNVKIIATNATAGAWTATYISSWVPGGSTLVFNAQAASTWLVTIYGRV